jgi:hypothetical protein
VDRLNTRSVKEQVSEMCVTQSMLVVRRTEQKQHWWMWRFHTGKRLIWGCSCQRIKEVEQTIYTSVYDIVDIYIIVQSNFENGIM